MDFILAQVKGKLPEGISQHLDGLTAGGGEDAGGLLDKVKGMAGGLFEKS